MDNLITLERLCEIVSVEKHIMLRWLREGEGPAFVKINRQKKMFTTSSIEEWLATKTVGE